MDAKLQPISLTYLHITSVNSPVLYRSPQRDLEKMGRVVMPTTCDHLATWLATVPLPSALSNQLIPPTLGICTKTATMYDTHRTIVYVDSNSALEETVCLETVDLYTSHFQLSGTVLTDMSVSL